MNKWDTWWDNLPTSTQEYLKTQAVWHDSDMFKAGLFGVVIGIVIGLML